MEKSIQHIKQINRRVGDRLTDDCGVRERQVRKYLVVDPWRIPGTLQESDSHEETPQQVFFCNPKYQRKSLNAAKKKNAGNGNSFF